MIIDRFSPLRRRLDSRAARERDARREAHRTDLDRHGIAEKLIEQTWTGTASPRSSSNRPGPARHRREAHRADLDRHGIAEKLIEQTWTGTASPSSSSRRPASGHGIATLAEKLIEETCERHGIEPLAETCERHGIEPPADNRRDLQAISVWPG